MSCCGKNKVSVTIPAPGNHSAASVSQPPARLSMAIFRYDGGTSLTVYGATGKRYWFGEPGAEVAVDLRDRAALRKVPVLREVRLA